MLTVHRQKRHLFFFGQRHHEMTGSNKAFLIGKGDIVSGVDRGEQRAQSRHTGNTVDHHIHPDSGGGFDAFFAAEDLAFEIRQKIFQFGIFRLIAESDHFRLKLLCLLREERGVMIGRQHFHFKFFGEPRHDIQTLGTDGSGGAQYSDGFHGIPRFDQNIR